MFDESGRMTDWAASHMNIEIALNLDNEAASAIAGVMDRILFCVTSSCSPVRD